MRAKQQWIWWTESARGIMTLAFGLLLLTSRSLAPRLLIYSLGAYLVIDGILELYTLHNRERISHVKPIKYLSGALSLLAGLLSVIFPTYTIYVLACIIALRLIFVGIAHMRVACTLRYPYTILSWNYSVFLVLLGILLLLYPVHGITLLALFLGSYMLIAGLYLLKRGISFRFQQSNVPSFSSRLPPVSPKMRDDLPKSSRRAIVFVRRTAAHGLGHVAWGFEWMNGWFNVGSVENRRSKPFASPGQMDFWSVHTLNPSTTILSGVAPYDEYKLFVVERPHPKEAWKTVIWESRQPYAFVHHNCCDATFEILHAYGCTELLDPAKEFVPNDWYDALPGRSYRIVEGTALPVFLRKQSRRDMWIREIPLAIPARVEGLPPSLGRRWRAWEELTLLWEMMIGHILTLCSSGIKFIKKHV
jgi:uncharacterized membrane protein HdeD (DUF308 family)